MPERGPLAVRDVMTRTPQCLDAAMPLAEAYAWLMGEGVRGAPVVDGERLIGVVSGSDLLAALAPILDPQEDDLDGATLTELKATPLRDLIERAPVTCRADEPLAEACRRMVKSRVRRLVVTGADGAVVGVLSATDVVWAQAGGERDDG